MKNILLIIFVFFIQGEASAEIFKCNSKGKVSYQSTPCNNKMTVKKNKKIIKKIKKNRKESACFTSCSIDDMICRGNLKHGNYNSDGGLKVCHLKLSSCKATCSNNTNASKLRLEYKLEKIEYLSMKRRIKLEERYKKNDKKYDRRIARIDEKSKKRCIRNTKERINRSYNRIIDPTWDDRRRHRRALEAVPNDC